MSGSDTPAGIARRDLFRLVAAGLAGTAAAPWFQTLAHAAQSPGISGKPKSCILLWLIGGRDKVIEHLYLLALSRLPTTAEASRMAAFAARQADPVKGYSAVLWVLLTSAEFINNH